MNKLSYKYKTYILASITAVLAIIFFLFIYGKMNAANQALADSVLIKRQEHEDILAEQKSYELGKQDLEGLSKKPLQPDDLFSQDTKVVKEIKTLESVSTNMGLDFGLQVSGSAKDATQIKTSTAKIATLPYTITLEGDFDKTINFIETTQHLPFITPIKTIRMTGSASGVVHTTLGAEFYLKP